MEHIFSNESRDVFAVEGMIESAAIPCIHFLFERSETPYVEYACMKRNDDIGHDLEEVRAFFKITDSAEAYHDVMTWALPVEEEWIAPVLEQAAEILHTTVDKLSIEITDIESVYITAK